MIIGIDIGSTITKAVSVEAGVVTRQVKTKAMDAVTSAAGAFGKMLIENNIGMKDIERIMITGAGAGKIPDTLFGISTENVGEITAIGIGGIFLSGRENIIISNVGTGTAIIEAHRNKIVHIGGSGVGGGTILGLSKKLLGMSNFNEIMALAESGNLATVDLLLGDIMNSDLSFLNKESTASNFAKMLDSAALADIALGIVNMVYQVIGMLSVFAARSRNIDTVIVTGNGGNNPIGVRILQIISEMYAIKFCHPDSAEYTTAIGAGLSGRNVQDIFL
ncbi:type II pantothenate kinase [Spirochaetia bacterium]|nr:type II pantothenate kinase [Spirochaetia bacterium]GHU33781.1 type II pantothenate kinase [Spirochaetia bacterium]